MTMKLHDAVAGDGLFDVLGKAFHAVDTLNTARLTTVPTEVNDFLGQIVLAAAGDALEHDAVVDGAGSATDSWRAGGSTLASAIQFACERILTMFVADDADLPEYTLPANLEYLIAQMYAAGAYVDANAVAASLAVGAANLGDVVVCYATVDGNGSMLQNAMAEDIEGEVLSVGSGIATIQFRGEERIADKLSQNWPGGSGCSMSLTTIAANSSLLSNGDFDAAAIADIPDDWIVGTGTPGETILLTDPAQQTVTISGTPTGGGYTLLWTNAQGITRSTETLSHDADAAAVQDALQAIPGLELVEISSSGTTPDYTHTITFTGVGGTVNQLTSVNNLTGGTAPAIAHATTVTGDAGSFNGRALCLVSDGNEETALYHVLSLTNGTVYFCHFRVRLDDTPPTAAPTTSAPTTAAPTTASPTTAAPTTAAPTTAAPTTAAPTSAAPTTSAPTTAVPVGELRIEIVDEIGGGVIADDAGNDASLTIDLATLSTDSHQSKWFAFAVARDTVQPVYLRVRLTDPPDAGIRIYLDEIAIAAGTQLYAGGPYVAAFAGVLPAVVGDQWNLTITNNRAGLLQTWFDRVFGMAEKGFLLATQGTTLIPDSLVG